MAPREVFTVATPAHQDSKGSQRQLPGLPQDSQTLFASSAQALSSSQAYAPQPPAFLPRVSNETPKDLPQNPPTNATGPRSPDVAPPSSSEKSPVPPYSTGTDIMQNPYDQKYNAGVTPPAPAYGYPGQQPSPYGQPSPSPHMTPPPQMQQPMQSMPMQTPGGFPMQTSQPGPAPGMDIRNVKGIPRDGNGEREWSHGCSECFDDCGTCMLGWCCPCMLYSQIQTRLNHLETRGTPHPSGGDSCAGDCFVHGLLTCCLGIGWVLQIGQRTAVRGRYRIAGDGCSDCMMAYCCSPCEMTQVSRELELEEHSFMAPMQQPMQQPPMQQPPPQQGNYPNPYPEKR